MSLVKSASRKRDREAIEPTDTIEAKRRSNSVKTNNIEDNKNLRLWASSRQASAAKVANVTCFEHGWSGRHEREQYRGEQAISLRRRNRNGTYYKLPMYTPLKPGEIRLLRLRPGRFGTSLIAAFETLDLEPSEESFVRRDSTTPFSTASSRFESPPPYEAVSYAWGKQEFPYDLHMQGRGCLSITVSLYSALQRFRLVDGDRLLWVDAVCINQKDVAERSAQVARMRETFERADRVLVWLGDPISSEDVGIDNFTKVKLAFALAEYVDKTTKLRSLRNQPAKLQRIDGLSSSSGSAGSYLSSFQGWIRQSSRCPCCHEPIQLSRFGGRFDDVYLSAAESLGGLLRRPWFTRLWVVQEVAFARAVAVHCGAHEIEWDKLLGACRSVAQEGVVGLTSHYPNQSEWQARMTRDFTTKYIQIKSRPEDHSSSNFISRLVEQSSLGCGDPRDRVFAVRSLLGLEHAAQFVPDYSITTSELYRRVAVHAWTCQPVSLASLIPVIGTEAHASNRSPPTLDDLPSWVPDFNDLTVRSRSRMFGTHDAACFIASERRFVCRTSPHSNHELQIKCRVFGTVGEILESSQCPRLFMEELARGVRQTVYWELDVLWWYIGLHKFVEKCKREGSSPPQMASILDRGCSAPRFEVKEDKAGYSISEICTYGTLEIMVQSWMGHPCHTFKFSYDFLRQAWKDLMPFLTTVPPQQIDFGKKLAVIRDTARNCFAWVPPAASHGDKVAILPGYSYPVILREGSNHCYKIVGDAWVNDISEWEALGMSENTWERMVGRVLIQPGSYEATAAHPRIDRNLEAWETEHIDWITLD